ncbi:FAD-dependent pyridine nucleotide-disulfide oxidoreductase [Petrotoga sp. 9T1HF07.CasAA.8.2]|uniref:FAD-dependent oxidoreductase n=1 Tax=unclassified Petrotoga TaxID=2620614 RepID=UPI000CA028B8|nr:MULTISPECIES: FAD-dependent oxidoreductase [unclassified Petrotoga]MBL5981118.1 pyridine nucleotide-disulfide oxidoreductase [Petrotoga sp. 8T1HF07.NaAc.6.1]PNR89439.1 FAD-dependent pyridine nucleotide-disulfide oxidoreductase [Petrotoga sp. 9T1HF07.CasAA.8.2]PNR93044.1 FAD-dependent pyridine nucleotide-disulfide oxidoreductase [Petrotoga sp. HWHPT.55.6.3]
MGKRILIVGGVAGGASVAARARRLDESAEIIMFERGPHVSFSNCALPFHLSGMVENSDDLVLMTPEQFKKQYNIEARVNSEVIKIIRDQKKVIVRNTKTGEEYEEHYDKLVLSPGAKPVLPKSIEGIDRANVFTVRNVVDIVKIKDYIEKNNIKDVAVVGGGYIGVEVAENLKLAGYNVNLIEALDQVMQTFDYDMVQILHKELYDNGVNLILSDSVTKIFDDYVELKSGKKVNARAVIMAVGVCPETSLAKDAGLEIGETGGIKVDHNYRTSDDDIYAVGDAIETYSALLCKPCRLPLAGPAQRQARAAADHIYNIPHINKGVIGSSVVKVFNLNAAATGLNEKQAKANNIPYDFVYIIPQDKVGLMPNSYQLHLKLIYEVPTGRILGAQAISEGDAPKRIDVIATLIRMNGTLEDLKELELCYAPLFSTAKDPVNHAALVGLNLLHGRFRQVPVTKVRELVENGAFIIDCRERDEYEKGHLKTAVNIPLSELRERLNEIPKDRPVYIHCRSSQRSYNAIIALQGRGYKNVFNISGSFLGTCYYEYYLDQITGREKIVTAYNFD